jgi:amidase
MSEIIYSSAAQLAAAIRSKKLSSVEVVEAHLKRIDEVNPAINAVVYSLADSARKQARDADAALARGEVKGPLHGVPFTIKDAWETAGVPSTGGTLGRKDYRPEIHATVVARLKAAGAIPIGMTNLPEFSMAFESDNLVHGRTNNPYDLSRTPGGSGGGGSAIIAAGGSPLEPGADMGGSIRLPSHFAGIAGIKPTTGLVPLTGYFPAGAGMAGIFGTAGPMARYVEDLTYTLPILAGPDGVDPHIAPVPLRDPKAVSIKGLRVAMHTDNGIMPAEPATAQTVRNAAKALADAGAIVEEARPAGIERCMELFTGIVFSDGGEGLRMLLRQCGTTLVHPILEASLNGFPMKSGAELAGLLYQLDVYRSTMLQWFRNSDVILCPTNALPAVPHGTAMRSQTLPAFSYTVAFNATGWPGAVVRCGTSAEGLPIGVQAVAHPWRDDVALAVVQHLETALGGYQRPQLAVMQRSAAG